MAKSVVPPPISINATPASFFFLTQNSIAEANGSNVNQIIQYLNFEYIYLHSCIDEAFTTT
jgi:hypothetical protein